MNRFLAVLCSPEVVIACVVAAMALSAAYTFGAIASEALL